MTALPCCNGGFFRSKVSQHLSKNPYSSNHNRGVNTADIKMSLILYKIELKKKKLSTPVRINGKIMRVIHNYPHAVSWLDIETGEIFLQKDIRTPIYDHSLLALQREFILSKLSPETFEFAKFVLSFRNRRGGISPSLNKLASMYSKLHGKNLSNVKRFANNLLKQGVLESSQLCSKLFMIYGKTLTYQNHVVIEQKLIDSATYIDVE